MYWLIIIIVILVLCLFPRREGFQEMFGFSGHRKSIDDTYFEYGSEQSGFTNVTSRDGVTHDDMNKCVSATMNFINEKLGICSHPVETSSVKKMEKDSEIVFRCKFMFLVTSTNYPFMLGVESDISGGKVIRASTQDMLKPRVPETMEDNFLSFNEIESQKVYSR